MLHRGRSRHPRPRRHCARGSRCAGERRQTLPQGHLQARTVHQRQPRARAADARALLRTVSRNHLGYGARQDRRRDSAHSEHLRTRCLRRGFHRPDHDRGVLHPRQTHARRAWHQQLRRQHHAVHVVGGVRLQALVRQRRPARLLRRLRAHRVPARHRLQPAGTAPDHFLAPARGAGKTQVPGDRGRPARHHVCANGRHAPASDALAPIWCCSTAWRT